MGDDFMPLEFGGCTQCGFQVEVDEKIEVAICPFCGTENIVKKY